MIPKPRTSTRNGKRRNGENAMSDELNIGIRVEGLSRLNSALNKLGEKEAGEAIKVANRTAAERILAGALPNVPMHTGKLKASLKALGSKRASSVKSALPYANAIHWGTGDRTGMGGPHNIPARPFLWDARAAFTDEVVKQYEAELDKILREWR